MQKEAKRLAGYDGRVSDLAGETNRHFMPWISDSWSSHFKWRGKGDFPEDEKAKLKDIVKRAHNNGQKVRFWAAPDNPPTWAVLHNNGVDLINSDQIKNLAKFLHLKKPQ